MSKAHYTDEFNGPSSRGQCNGYCRLGRSILYAESGNYTINLNDNTKLPPED